MWATYVYYYRARQQANRLTDKDTVVLADFANSTATPSLRALQAYPAAYKDFLTLWKDADPTSPS